MRVLITGAEGFTGRYMGAELAAAGYQVHGLVREPVSFPQAYSLYVGDLLQPDSLVAVIEKVRPAAVIHLAGMAFVAHGNIADIYANNLVGTRNLLQALVDAAPNVQTVLLASSANVYGNVGGDRLDELVSPRPANDYAVSKLAMEFAAALFSQRLPIVITRPFNYTGVGQSANFVLPKIVDHFRRGADVIELGNLDVARDFLDVRTVVGYYRRLLETPAAVGGTYNVCSGQAWTLGQVLDLLRQISGRGIEVRVNPAFVRPDEVKILCGSAERLQSVVGVPPAISLSQTLRWMLEAS
jgi:nucleoside-diphosphate-sugar epimerase